jgi:hypothetical protein
VIAEIVSLPHYESQVAALMSEEERLAMEYFIACSPEAHPVIPHTGGFRKARWARRGQGKSGGYRVIYFFISPPGQVHMASIFAKSRKQTLSAAEESELASMAAWLKRQTRES